MKSLPSDIHLIGQVSYKDRVVWTCFQNAGHVAQWNAGNKVTGTSLFCLESKEDTRTVFNLAAGGWGKGSE